MSPHVDGPGSNGGYRRIAKIDRCIAVRAKRRPGILGDPMDLSTAVAANRAAGWRTRLPPDGIRHEMQSI
jgi:hypothetical protein